MPTSAQGLMVAVRPRYLPGGLLLYAVGLAAAGRRAPALEAAAGLCVVALVHAVTHFVNDAADVETDARARPTGWSGGSRAIQRGLATPAGLLRAATALAALVVALAAWEAASGRGRAAALHLAILGLGWAYSGWPLALGRRGLGEAVTGLVMGVLVPLAGAAAAGATVPAALLGMLFAQTAFARLCTAWPDLAADRATGKWTLPALLGPRRSALAFAAAAAASLWLGLAAAPLVPHPAWQRANALLFALAAGAVAAWVGAGRAAAAPERLPQASFFAYGSSLLMLLATLLIG